MKRAFGIAADHLTPAELIRNLLTADGRPVVVRRHRHLRQSAAARAMPRSATAPTTRCASTARRFAPRWSARAPISASPSAAASPMRSPAAASTPTRSTTRPASIPRTTRSTSRSCSAARSPRGAAAGRSATRCWPQMADEVAALVLRDNYLQGEALSVAEARGAAILDRQAAMIRDLERAGRLDRALEFLPDDETLAARAAARPRPDPAGAGGAARLRQDVARRGPARPPTCPTQPELADELRGYFPAAVRQRFARTDRRPSAAPRDHRDRRHQRSGQPRRPDLRPRHARAHRPRGARHRPQLPDRPRRLRAAGAVEPRSRRSTTRCRPQVQTEMLLDIAGADRARRRLAAARQPARYRPRDRAFRAGVCSISRRSSPELLPAGERALLDRARRAARRTPACRSSSPRAIAGVIFLTTGFEVGDLAERTGAAGRPRGADFLRGRRPFRARRDARRGAPPAGRDRLSEGGGRDADRRFLRGAGRIRGAGAGGRGPRRRSASDPLAAWVKDHAGQLAPAEAVAAELRAAAAPDLAMLVVASRQLRQALA